MSRQIGLLRIARAKLDSAINTSVGLSDWARAESARLQSAVAAASTENSQGRIFSERLDAWMAGGGGWNHRWQAVDARTPPPVPGMDIVNIGPGDERPVTDHDVARFAGMTKGMTNGRAAGSRGGVAGPPRRDPESGHGRSRSRDGF
ncbi:hypothetical protein AB0D08_36885 [Kitasatospora sp. NPDC048540]|uniref:hypothetical protein n=1 Tax=Kitasatospora sp. NPDC048540 TaxID=3155634 RepID=UPI0033E964E2